MRTIKTITVDAEFAVIVRFNPEWEEYVVEQWYDREHMKGADYFTSDRGDALGTAEVIAKGEAKTNSAYGRGGEVNSHDEIEAVEVTNNYNGSYTYWAVLPDGFKITMRNSNRLYKSAWRYIKPVSVGKNQLAKHFTYGERPAHHVKNLVLRQFTITGPGAAAPAPAPF